MNKIRYTFLLIALTTSLTNCLHAQPSSTEQIVYDGYNLLGRNVYRYQNKVYKGFGVFEVVKSNPNSLHWVERSKRQRKTGIVFTVLGSATTVYAFTQILVRPAQSLTPLITGSALMGTGALFAWQSRNHRQRAINQFNLDATTRKYQQDTSSNKRPWNSIITIYDNDFTTFNNYMIGNQPVRRKKIMEMMRTDYNAKPFAILADRNTKTSIIATSTAVVGIIAMRLMEDPVSEEIPANRATLATVVGSVTVGCIVTTIITQRAARRAETNGIRILNGENIIPFNRTHQKLGRQNISLLLGTGNYGVGLVAKW